MTSNFFSLSKYIRTVIDIETKYQKEDYLRSKKKTSGSLLSILSSPYLVPVLAAVPVVLEVIKIVDDLKSSSGEDKLTLLSTLKNKISNLVNKITGAEETTGATTSLKSAPSPTGTGNISIPRAEGRQSDIVRYSPAKLGLAGILPARGSYTQDEANTIVRLKESNADTSGYKTSMNPKIEELIRSKALEYGVDPDIAVKIATVESGGNPNAISGTGAIGIFQFTGGTANAMGLINRFNLVDNIDAGIRLIVSDRPFVGAINSDISTYLALQIGVPNAKYIFGIDRSTKIVDLPAIVKGAISDNLGGNSSTVGEYIDINAAALQKRILSQKNKPVYSEPSLTTETKLSAVTSPAVTSKPPPLVVTPSTDTKVAKEITPTTVKPNYQAIPVPKVTKPDTNISMQTPISHDYTQSPTLDGVVRHKSGLYFNVS